MELGRVILLVRGERFSIVRVNWLTKIFVAGDVLSFLMQASGGFAPLLFSSRCSHTALCSSFLRGHPSVVSHRFVSRSEHH